MYIVRAGLISAASSLTIVFRIPAARLRLRNSGTACAIVSRPMRKESACSTFADLSGPRSATLSIQLDYRDLTVLIVPGPTHQLLSAAMRSLREHRPDGQRTFNVDLTSTRPMTRCFISIMQFVRTRPASSVDRVWSGETTGPRVRFKVGIYPATKYINAAFLDGA